MALRIARVVAVPLGLALILQASGANAQFYRWVDKNGNVHYTDRPPPPSEIRERSPTPRPPDPGVVTSPPAAVTRPPAAVTPPPAMAAPSPAPPPQVAAPTRVPAPDPVVPPAPPLTIAGTRVGNADAERRRTAAIDELFRLLDLQTMLTMALVPPEVAGDDAKSEKAARFRRSYLGSARGSFRPYFVDQHAEAARIWLRSPLGHRIGTALSTDAASTDVESYASRSDATSDERRRLVSRFGRASQFGEIAVTPMSVIMLTMQFAMLSALPQAFEAAAPQGSDPGNALLGALTSGMGAMVKEGLKKQTTRDALRSAVDDMVEQTARDDGDGVDKQLVYRLREVSDDDLVSALQFFESGAGRWLGMAIRLASRDAAVATVEDTLRQIQASGSRGK